MTPEQVKERVEKLEQQRRRKIHSGIAVWTIAVLVGIASGLIVLGLANHYANQQRERATRAAAVKLNDKTRDLASAAALKQYLASLAACERGNALRRTLNGGAIKTLHDFLVTARIARRAAANAAPTRAEQDLNRKAAASYTLYLARLGPLPLIRCASVFTKP